LIQKFNLNCKKYKNQQRIILVQDQSSLIIENFAKLHE
jgi:hypothetical protein